MNISIPELALVVLVGPSGAGKSSFARAHFKPTEVVSSDFCRGVLADDENAQHATDDAFDLLHYIVAKRLKNGLLTVVDATNVRAEDRRRYVQLAREFHCLPVAIVLNLPEQVCQDRNAQRPDRDFGPHVIRNQRLALRRGMGGRGGKGLKREGYRYVWVLESEAEANAVTIERAPLWNNKKDVPGPFDIIGDIHGCYEETVELLRKLGYEVEGDAGDCEVRPPTTQGVPRTLVFLGDLVDRGPASPAVLRLVMRLVEEGKALCVPGNHDAKLLRYLNGKNVRLTYGLDLTVEQLSQEQPEFVERVRSFIDGLVSHYVLDGGRLVVAHAGLKEEMQGRGSGAVREFCLYGETTGETDEYGLPVRLNWAMDYRGRAAVVYGHVPVPSAQWLNNTICLDTGCVYGGRLSALRYPEREVVSVEARAAYAESKKPFLPGHDARFSAQQLHDDALDLGDVTGKRVIETGLERTVIVREENATAALEIMSRFAADPRWLIYLPPTMSPCETSEREAFLEHPAEALAYYRDRGVARVICEEKHMGSRAVVVACRDAKAAEERFGVATGEFGIVYTRTGRRFFSDLDTEAGLIGRVIAAADRAGLWDDLSTDWLCLDCELMPWSAKAQQLVREQYAAVGSAAMASTGAAVEQLRGHPGVTDLLERYERRQADVERYAAAYRNYCWEVNGLDDLRLAPFHLLASEGAVHTDKDHAWHMSTLARLVGDDPVLMATVCREVDLSDGASVESAIGWWQSMTAAGGEGMVVKPLDFIVRDARGVLQPAVKCRGPEYLRIIYGPEYLEPENLERLRKRGLRHKRSLAIREFALGLEALERFVRREPLRRVHECVFGVLALESEPVDPRL